MLVRSSSTPVLGALHASSGGHSPAVHFADSSPTVAYHPPAISCSLSSAGGGGSDHERSRGSTGGGGGLRRACSDGNLSSLGGRADDHHRSRPAPLETIQSFAARDGSWDEEDENDADDDTEQEMSFGMFGAGTYTQEHPLFLARGLGIDRLGSGLLLADDGGINDGNGGGTHPVASGGGGDRSGIEAHYKQLIEEDPCNGLFLRNYARFLYRVKGDRRRAEEYYSRDTAKTNYSPPPTLRPQPSAPNPNPPPPTLRRRRRRQRRRGKVPRGVAAAGALPRRRVEIGGRIPTSSMLGGADARGMGDGGGGPPPVGCPWTGRRGWDGRRCGLPLLVGFPQYSGRGWWWAAARPSLCAMPSTPASRWCVEAISGIFRDTRAPGAAALGLTEEVASSSPERVGLRLVVVDF